VLEVRLVVPIVLIGITFFGCRGRAERPPDAWDDHSGPAGIVRSPTPVSEVYRVGGEVKAPRIIGQMNLPIPERCRTHHKFSDTIFVYEAVITEVGEVRSIKTLKKPTITPPCPEWEEKQVEALSHWRFEPATRKGKPVAVMLTISQTIDF